MENDWDDEDWYDDPDEEPGASEGGRCPECGGVIYDVVEMCPACGYWLTEADRQATWSSEARPAWVKLTAVLVLAAFLIWLLVALR